MMREIPENLRALDDKIRQYEQTRPVFHEKQARGVGFGIGFSIMVELVSGVLIGAGIGYLLDMLFSLRPICLAVFVLLGGAAGFLNIYRMAKEKERKGCV